jgi:hypothetical protein
VADLRSRELRHEPFYRLDRPPADARR